MENYIAKARTLIEALPWIKRHSGKRIVIKYGGNAMENRGLQEMFATDVVLMHFVGIEPVIVHGGGPQISYWMKKQKKKPVFIDGLRYTDGETMKIVQDVLINKISKHVVSLINEHGDLAVSLSGSDTGLMKSKKIKHIKEGKPVDLGFVGDVVSVNSKAITSAIKDGFIPVIASIGYGRNGESYNINADTVAAEVAVACKAEKIIFLTDVEGILMDPGDNASLVSELSVEEANKLIVKGKVEGGMIPKIEACIHTIEQGVKRAHILNGVREHALLLEIFTDEGIGTMIKKGLK